MKHIIWTWNVDFADWEDDLRAEYPDEPEDWLYGRMYEINADYLDDERINLNIPLRNKIICIASLGLWNGRHVGYRILDNNVNECFRYFEDRPTWYVENGDLCCEDIHHDGTNYYRYREVKDGVDLEEFLDKLYEGSATEEDVEHYTKPLGDRVANVYGWEVA